MNLKSRNDQFRGRLEMTPEMIEAGMRVLQDSGRLEYEAPGSDELLVTAVFQAMELKRLSSV